MWCIRVFHLEWLQSPGPIINIDKTFPTIIGEICLNEAGNTMKTMHPQHFRSIVPVLTRKQIYVLFAENDWLDILILPLPRGVIHISF